MIRIEEITLRVKRKPRNIFEAIWWAIKWLFSWLT